MRSSDPAQDGPRLFRKFLEKHYHRPSDDLSLPMDDKAVALYTRVQRPRQAAGHCAARRSATH